MTAALPGTIGAVKLAPLTIPPAVMAGPLFTAMLRVALAVTDVASVTWTLKVKVPVAVGVPEITPAAERLRPFGSDPEARDHV